MKHRFLLAMLLICACLLLTAQAAEERFTPGADAVVFSTVPLVLYGDATGDGKITLLDCLRILRRSVNDTVTLDLAAADSSGNLTVDIADVLLTLKEILR